MPDDYGYFGKGTEGYMHYMQTFNDSFRKNGGGNRPPKGGCFTQIIGIIAFFALLVWFLIF